MLPVRGLDRLTLAASAWVLAAFCWDIWAHRHEQPESFFTLWHAAIYSGLAVLAAVLLGTISRGARAPVRGGQRCRPGYGWAVVGVALFALGGVADALWHTAFGVEVQTDALLSPSHLVLAAAGLLIFTAPLRARWARADTVGVGLGWPATLALAFVVLELQLFTHFAGPYSGVLAGGRSGSFADLERELLGVFLYSALIAGVVLLGLRRPPLPFGALTLLHGSSATALVLVHGDWPAHVQLTRVAIAAAAGMVADVLLWRLRPTYGRPALLRALSFVIPASYFAIYLAVVTARFGTWYSVHALTGTVVLSGVVGLLLSYVAVPPHVAEVEPAK